MAYDELLEQRIRTFFDSQAVPHEAKRMMGGLCFMVHGKMCVGISDDRLMVRLDPAMEAEARTKPGGQPMDFTGRPMKGYVFVEPVGTRTPAQLCAWLKLALEFNPKAKASKKRRTAGGSNVR